MTIDQARAKDQQVFCSGRHHEACAWITVGGMRAVGFHDTEFRYRMGQGDTWEEAFEDAHRRSIESGRISDNEISRAKV